MPTIKTMHLIFTAEYINQNHCFYHFFSRPDKNSMMVQKHVKNHTLRVVNNLSGPSADQIAKALHVVQIFFCLFMKDLECAIESALIESADGTKLEAVRLQQENKGQRAETRTQEVP